MGLYERLLSSSPDASDTSIASGLNGYFAGPQQRDIHSYAVDLPAMLNQQMQVGTSVRVNPQNWERMLAETPPSQNIEDRRDEIGGLSRFSKGGLDPNNLRQQLEWKQRNGMGLSHSEQQWLMLDPIAKIFGR